VLTSQQRVAATIQENNARASKTISKAVADADAAVAEQEAEAAQKTKTSKDEADSKNAHFNRLAEESIAAAKKEVDTRVKIKADRSDLDLATNAEKIKQANAKTVEVWQEATTNIKNAPAAANEKMKVEETKNNASNTIADIGTSADEQVGQITQETAKTVAQVKNIGTQTVTAVKAKADAEILVLEKTAASDIDQTFKHTKQIMDESHHSIVQAEEKAKLSVNDATFRIKESKMATDAKLTGMVDITQKQISHIEAKAKADADSNLDALSKRTATNLATIKQNAATAIAGHEKTTAEVRQKEHVILAESSAKLSIQAKKTQEVVTNTETIRAQAAKHIADAKQMEVQTVQVNKQAEILQSEAHELEMSAKRRAKLATDTSNVAKAEMESAVNAPLGPVKSVEATDSFLETLAQTNEVFIDNLRKTNEE